jgi:hypothetical protein
MWTPQGGSVEVRGRGLPRPRFSVSIMQDIEICGYPGAEYKDNCLVIVRFVRKIPTPQFARWNSL